MVYTNFSNANFITYNIPLKLLVNDRLTKSTLSYPGAILSTNSNILKFYIGCIPELINSQNALDFIIFLKYLTLALEIGSYGNNLGSG